MYTPKIKADLVEMLTEIKGVRGKPITALLDDLLRPQVYNLYRETIGTLRYTVQLELFEIREPQPEKQVNISSPADVWRLCIDMTQLSQERLDVLMLDTKNNVMKRQMVFLGSLNASLIHPREIYAPAIAHRAASVVLVHNHPSSDTTPSQEDINATKQVKKAGDIIGIPLLDHVIIGDDFTSLKEEGFI